MDTRYFIQYMLKNGISTIPDAVKYCKKHSKDAVLQDIINECNNKIQQQSFKIVTKTCEITNEDFLVWTNQKQDEAALQQNNFNVAEKEYFQAILKELVKQEEHCLEPMFCLNISSTLTKDSAEKLLELWVRNGYLVKKENKIFVGVRTLLEFGAFLRQSTNNTVCELCSEFILVGKACKRCNKPFHGYCLAKYHEKRSICPCCKMRWHETSILNSSTVSTDSD